jgi:hypothetical protein
MMMMMMMIEVKSPAGFCLAPLLMDIFAGSW